MHDEGLAIAAFRELIGLGPGGWPRQATMVLSRIRWFDLVRWAKWFRPPPPDIARFRRFVYWDSRTQPTLRDDAPDLDKGYALEKTLDLRIHDGNYGQPALTYFQTEVGSRRLVITDYDKYFARFVRKIPDYEARMAKAQKIVRARLNARVPNREANERRFKPALRALERHSAAGARFVKPLGSEEKDAR